MLRIFRAQSYNRDKNIEAPEKLWYSYKKKCVLSYLPYFSCFFSFNWERKTRVLVTVSVGRPFKAECTGDINVSYILLLLIYFTYFFLLERNYTFSFELLRSLYFSMFPYCLSVYFVHRHPYGC